MWLSVPILSSLPQRPQLESALKASSTACFDTLMLRLLDVSAAGIVSILDRSGVAVDPSASCPRSRTHCQRRRPSTAMKLFDRKHHPPRCLFLELSVQPG